MSLSLIKTWLPLLAATAALAACQNNTPTGRPTPGQTSFLSAPPGGFSNGSRSAGGKGEGSYDSGAPTGANTGGHQATTPTRTVEETDLYRLEGDRLYYLNGYRGLMVFDVSNPDRPKLLGRSAIYGSPVDMIVRDGVATVVVGDWYGQLADGTPFHGSVVRGLDATDPAHIKVVGEARLGGWVQDDRIVGDVLYAVSVDYGWEYGWRGAYFDGVSGTGGVGVGSTTSDPQQQIVVSSVSFANGQVKAVGEQKFPGYTGIFHVTPKAILLAHDDIPAGQPPYTPASKTELLYLDITDPAGAIVKRGALSVNGRAQGWGPDNGRWNVDFADGKTAHVIGCADGNCGTGYVLATADFSNPDHPVLASELDLASQSWGVTARFDAGRMYLSPDNYSYNGGGTTPFQIYDLSNPAAPKLAGKLDIPGTVWNILPAPLMRIFALGQDWNSQQNNGVVSLKYLDVSDPTTPILLGTSNFGQGWAWTPAAGTFKAFTMDADKGLVVLPFSGWDSNYQSYNNGLQLIEFTAQSTRTAGAAKTRGWVERGIFVGNRLVSLSDLALSVVDYTNHDSPTVTAQLTLARNVVAANPQGTTIAEVSSDWWDNDVTTSEVRVLPITNVEENTDDGTTPSVNVDGVNARVFRNGGLTYVITSVRTSVTCPNYGGGSPDPSGVCYGRTPQIQVVDTTGAKPVLRGKISLPASQWGYYWYGWYGYYWYDWYDGSDVVQVGKDALAFRRWEPVWDGNGYIVDSTSALWVVDLANPDAPSIASTTITQDPNAWWGNMRVIGDTLYATHYEWIDTGGTYWTCRYLLDRVDLADRKHPKIGASINVPGLLVGGSESDPSILYTIDYWWDNNTAKNDFDVIQVSGDTATLLSRTELEGYVGGTHVVANKAYMSQQLYTPPEDGGVYGSDSISLHEIDLSNPNAPVDRASKARDGWGWLLAVVGDRAIVSSGWGQAGVDIYKLVSGQPPEYSQFARTRGWSTDEVTRQDNALFISSGYWGVEKIDLK